MYIHLDELPVTLILFTCYKILYCKTCDLFIKFAKINSRIWLSLNVSSNLSIMPSLTESIKYRKKYKIKKGKKSKKCFLLLALWFKSHRHECWPLVCAIHVHIVFRSLFIQYVVDAFILLKSCSYKMEVVYILQLHRIHFPFEVHVWCWSSWSCGLSGFSSVSCLQFCFLSWKAAN